MSFLCRLLYFSFCSFYPKGWACASLSCSSDIYVLCVIAGREEYTDLGASELKRKLNSSTWSVLCMAWSLTLTLGYWQAEAEDSSLCSPLLLETSQRAQVSQSFIQTNASENHTGRKFLTYPRGLPHAIIRQQPCSSQDRGHTPFWYLKIRF